MRRFLSITKALADETRLRILMALRGGELCICQIIALLNLSPSTVSRHIFLLSHANLIEKRKSGKWFYCRLADPTASPEVKAALAMTTCALAEDEIIRRDVSRLTEITACSLAEVCLPQKRKRSAKR